MKLYTSSASANAYKAELLLALTARAYERVEVRIFEGESRTKEFLAKNPAGRVPVLELDDGTALPESNAILWHLARGTAYMPASTFDQDRALAWLMFEQSEIEPTIGSARFWKLTGRDRDRRDEFVRRVAWAEQGVALLDRELAGKPFLIGNRASVADLAVYAYTHLAPDLGIALPANLTAWCDRLRALPGWLARELRYPA